MTAALVGTNLCVNPSTEYISGPWNVYGAGPTWVLDSTQAAIGAKSHKITAATTGVQGLYLPRFAVTPGQTIQVTAYVLSTAKPVNTNYVWRDAALAQVGVTTAGATTQAGAGWQRNVYQIVVPANAATVELRWFLNTPAIGDTFNLDAVLVHVGTSPLPFFDGDTRDILSDVYSWSGTPGNSQSTWTKDPAIVANLIPNPSFETDVAGWVNYGSPARVRDATIARVGNASQKMTSTAPANTTGAFVRFPVTVGRTYQLTAYVLPGAVRVNTSYGLRNVSGSQVGASVPGPDSIGAGWHRPVYQVTIPPGIVELEVRWSFVSTAANESFNLDAVLVHEGTTALPYFDGDSVDTFPNVYAWVGTAHASLSTRTLYPDPAPTDLVEIWADPANTSVPAVDLSCFVDAIAIRHGRDDADSQSDAATATIELSWDTDVERLPDVVEIGAPIRVTSYTWPTAAHIRFFGYVTDFSGGWDDVGEATPSSPVAQLIAAGPLSNLGRRVVGDEPWPQELDGARVARIASLAGMPLDPLTSDPGTVQILPRDVDAQDALELMKAIAQDALGLVWETRGGAVRYADAEHRRNVAPLVTLDACDILVTPEWRRSTEGLVNDVSIGYGLAPADPPEGGESEQPRFRDSNAKSITRYGKYAVSVGTQLADLAAAQTYGGMLLARNSAPVWIMSDLPVDFDGLPEDVRAILLDLEQGDLVRLTGLPIFSSAPVTTDLWLEGWSETLAYGAHGLTLAVSGYCRTAPAPRWNDIPSGWTWDVGNGEAGWASMTWDDATCVGPTPSLGRWDDVAASLRWNTVDPAITWDTWKG